MKPNFFKVDNSTLVTSYELSKNNTQLTLIPRNPAAKEKMTTRLGFYSTMVAKDGGEPVDYQIITHSKNLILTTKVMTKLREVLENLEILPDGIHIGSPSCSSNGNGHLSQNGV